MSFILQINENRVNNSLCVKIKSLFLSNSLIINRKLNRETKETKILGHSKSYFSINAYSQSLISVNLKYSFRIYKVLFPLFLLQFYIDYQ